MKTWPKVIGAADNDQLERLAFALALVAEIDELPLALLDPAAFKKLLEWIRDGDPVVLMPKAEADDRARRIRDAIDRGEPWVLSAPSRE